MIKANVLRINKYNFSVYCEQNFVFRYTPNDSILNINLNETFRCHLSIRGRRSRSESDSPPYLRQPVSLPPITNRPKTNGGERENKLFGQDRPKTMGGGTTGGITTGTAGIITGSGKSADFQVTVSGLALR